MSSPTSGLRRESGGDAPHGLAASRDRAAGADRPFAGRRARRRPALTPVESRATLGELARFFLRLGTLAFGGPAAHIAMMEEEVVRRRGWLTRERFLDLVGASNLIPGPSSTELAIHIGYAQRGWAGLVLAGVCFIAPAALMVAAIAHVYLRYRGLPEVAGALYGIKPVIIAVVGQALLNLGRAAVKTRWLAMLAVAVLALNLAGVSAVALLFGAGAGVALLRWRRGTRATLSMILGGGPWSGLVGLGGAAGASGAAGLVPLFLVFLKIGAVVYGSGYVLLAFLRADLVEHLGWLTESQLLDAVAVGQFTPGPVFTTATFIGYLVAGPLGAVVATVAIFLPGFVLVAASAPFVARLRASTVFGGFLDGVNAASVALMAAVAIELARTSINDPTTLAIGLVAAILLIRFRINSAWLVLAGGAVGFLTRAV